MRSHIRLGKIFGIEVGIHYSWFIIALLITFSLAEHFRDVNPGWAGQVVWGAAIITSVLFFAGLLAHELSHSIMARSRNLPVSRITLFALGGVSVIEKEAPDAKTEFLVAIVGPLCSVIIGGVLLGMVRIIGGAPDARLGTAILYWLGMINISLGVFNLLPGFPLDGGRVLRSLVWGVTHDMERSTKIASRVGQFVALLFIVFGIFSFFQKQHANGLWIAFIGWFLLQAAGANYLEVEMKHALAGLKASDLMSHECPVVEGNISVQDLVDHFILRTGRRCYMVAVLGRTAGLVTPHEIRALNRDQWQLTPVQQIMKPLEKIHVVAPDTPAMDVLEMMTKEDLNQVPVISGRGVEGMLARGEILQALKSRIEMRKAS